MIIAGNRSCSKKIVVAKKKYKIMWKETHDKSDFFYRVKCAWLVTIKFYRTLGMCTAKDKCSEKKI